MERVDRLKIGSTILEAKKKVKDINSKKIMNIVSSKVVPFSKSGAYIPISQDYKQHKVYVIIMEDKDEKKK